MKLYGGFLRVSNTKRILDKYPELIFRVPFVSKMFPDARFIFLVRDGWQTCSSIKKWSERLGVTDGAETHDWWGIDDRKWKLFVNEIIDSNPIEKEQMFALKDHTNRAALEWAYSMQEGLQYIQSKNVFLLKYEDLLANTDSKIDELLNFCDLDKDKVVNQYANEVLSPAVKHSSFKLHPLVEKKFRQILNEFSY